VDTLYLLAVWLIGDVLVSINVVALYRPWLVITICGFYCLTVLFV